MAAIGGFASAVRQVIAGMHVDSAATAEIGPYSVSLSGNTYTLTHNLGLAAATDLIIQITPIVASNVPVPVIRSIGTNSFTYDFFFVGIGLGQCAHFITLRL